jgi:hypothetical protein
MNQGAGRRVLMKKTACKKSHATVPLNVKCIVYSKSLKHLTVWSAKFRDLNQLVTAIQKAN